MRNFLYAVLAVAFNWVVFTASAQAPCPPAGIETDPPIATNPGGRVNTFNWYYGNYQPGAYNGRRYTLSSTAIGNPYIELPWQQPNNINMERFQGQNDIPGNGWELIRRDLGYDDNNNLATTKNPTVIIYNRYTGILRVFVAVGQQYNGYQLAEVKLVFSEAARYKAGTLNRAAALGVALEDTESGTGTQFSAIARYLNDNSKWFVADFPMDYDPCVCLFDSRLRVEVNLIEQLQVNLQGTTTGSVTTANGSTTGDFSNGVPFIRKVNGAITAAGTSYDNVDKLTKSLISEGGNKSAIDQLNTAAKSSSFLKDHLSQLPYVGAAIGLLDFFLGGGQDSAPQPIALQPLAIDMSTKTTGTISATNLYVTIPFHNPGNRIANTIPEAVPYYNESMGIFSLLRRPQIDFTEVEKTGSTRSAPRTVTQTFRLTQDLLYAINPAAGVTVQDFQVALVGEGTSSNDGVPGGSFRNLEGTTIESDGSTRPLYRTAYVDAACVKNTKFTWVSTYQSGGVDATPTSKIFIKIMVNLKRNNATSTTQNILFAARYPADYNTVSSFTTIPTAACGVLAQAAGSDIQSVCSGSKYTGAVTLLWHPVVTTDGSSDGPQSSKGSAEFMEVSPNPASSKITVSYGLVQAGPVTISLYDALGRSVLELVNIKKGEAGSFTTSASVGSLSPGIYFCTLTTATSKTVQRLVVK